jgi:hypothetical protein
MCYFIHATFDVFEKWKKWIPPFFVPCSGITSASGVCHRTVPDVNTLRARYQIATRRSPSQIETDFKLFYMFYGPGSISESEMINMDVGNFMSIVCSFADGVSLQRNFIMYEHNLWVKIGPGHCPCIECLGRY